MAVIICTESPSAISTRPTAGLASSGIRNGAGSMKSLGAERMPGEHPRLDWLLDNWVRYQYAGGTRHLSVKTQRMWSSGSSDFDTMVMQVDLKSALVVDALVWDLSEAERTAVMHKHTGAVWRLNRLDMDVCYGQARIRISAGLIRRHIP